MMIVEYCASEAMGDKDLGKTKTVREEKPRTNVDGRVTKKSHQNSEQSKSGCISSQNDKNAAGSASTQNGTAKESDK